MKKVIRRFLFAAVLINGSSVLLAAEQTDAVGGEGGAYFYNECGGEALLPESMSDQVLQSMPSPCCCITWTPSRAGFLSALFFERCAGTV